MQTLILRGAGGSQQLRGVCTEGGESAVPPPSPGPKCPAPRGSRTHRPRRGSQRYFESPEGSELGT